MPNKEEMEIYGQIIYNHKLSIRSIIREFFLNIFAKKYRIKESIYYEDAMFPSILQQTHLKYIAIIKDGIVLDMIRIKPEVADMMLDSKSKLVEYDPIKNIVKRGTVYKNRKFINNIIDEEVENVQKSKED